MIARQYNDDFAEVWHDGVPAIMEGLRRTQTLEGAILFAQLTILAKFPDSLILRKLGLTEAQEVSRHATEVLAADWPHKATSWSAFMAFDAWLRAAGHQRNPGTTADLLTACLFILLREDTIRLPLVYPWPAGFPS
jgi:triphosphoribosyl-dephospho-CoA synthase